MLNPQFPNYANSAAGTEVIGWTIVGGQPLYRLPVAYVDTGFGAAYVCEGSTVEGPTYPDGVYAPDPKIESAGTISGSPEVGTALTFVPGTVTGTAPITVQYNWIRYNPGGTSLIVGTGLNYTVQIADAAYNLVVQTVASNSVGTVGTQTVPYGPCLAPAPIITDPGTIEIAIPNSDPSYCPVPGDVLSFSGATIFSQQPNYSTFTTWVNANNSDEVWQLGGDTFVIPPTAVGDEVAVRTTVFGAGGSSFALTNTIAVCGEIVIQSPSKISIKDPLYVGDGLTGTPAVFQSYGPPSVSFGFVDVTDPNNPIPVGYADSTTFSVTAADFGKSFAFRTIGTIGILTATSLSEIVGPAEGYLNVVTKPVISYTGDTAYPGTIVTGTPAVFDAVPAITSTINRFYRNDGTAGVPNWVGIGTIGDTTYTLTEAEVGKDVAYGTTAFSPLYPLGVLSLSNPIRPGHFFTFTSQGSYTNLTVPGAPPKVGDRVQLVYPQSQPQNTAYGGTVPIQGQLRTLQGGASASDPYTILASWFGRDAYATYSVTFEGNTYTQNSPTWKIGGTRPIITAPGTVTSTASIPFQPGTVATFTKPTVQAGIPAAYTEAWTWYTVKAGGTKTAIQNGGLTLNLSDVFVGLLIEVDYTVTNAAGSDSGTYTSSVPVPAPSVYFTSVGQLTVGSTNFAKVGLYDNSIQATYSASTATDGSADPITITKEYILCNSLGSALPSGIQTQNNYPSVGSYLLRNSAVPNSKQFLSDPPGDPSDTPFPGSGNYTAIKWTAVNPKTGSSATALSNIVGPLNDPTIPYGGTTPWAFTATKGTGTTYNCTLTLPTFNNGGAVQVSSLEIWVSAISPFTPSRKYTGVTTFTATESELYTLGLFGIYYVTGPQGRFGPFNVTIS